MSFNPDDPHDGRAAASGGFTYRMIHIGPDLLAEVTGRRCGLPLFTSPVRDDPRLARALTRLHTALAGEAGSLQRAERLTMAASALAIQIRLGPRQASPARMNSREMDRVAQRIRAFLRDAYPTQITSDDLAALAGGSRYAAYRAFRASYGLAPSEYQRQVRLRAARAMLAGGMTPAAAAAAAGFADQAHLTRWFRRCYAITPGAYQRAGSRQPGSGLV